MGEFGFIATLTSPAVWPVAVVASTSTLALTVAVRRLADWCEAASLGVTTGEWRELNRARLGALKSVRMALRNRPQREADKFDWAAPAESKPESVFSMPRRVLTAPAEGQAAHSGVPEAHRGPPQAESTGPDARSQAKAASQTVVPQALSSESRDGLGRIRFGTASLFMPASDHVREFLEYERADRLGKNPISGRWESKRSDRGWVEAYHVWARGRSIVAIPAATFLALLAKAPGVDKSRDRLKDPATCRVLKNEHGTPLRATFYTVFELPPELPRAAQHSRSASRYGAGMRRAA